MSRSAGQTMEIRQRGHQPWRTAALNQDEEEIVDALSSSTASYTGTNLDPLLLRAARGEVCRSVDPRICFFCNDIYIYFPPCIPDEGLTCITLSVNIESGEDPSMDDETSRKAYEILQRFGNGSPDI